MDVQLTDTLRRALAHFEAGGELLRQALRTDQPAYTAPTPLWPLAVPPPLIVRRGNRVAAALRARQILESLSDLITDADVLDYGCGEGWEAYTASAAARTVLGYDPTAADQWRTHSAPNLSFTTRLDMTQSYDVIICHDVLDHADIEHQMVMDQLRDLVRPAGRIYLRVHPWTSRHGGHQYEGNGNNKAYWQLTVPADEVRKIVDLPRVQVVRPLATYEALIKTAGLEVIDRQVDSAEPEAYFTGQILDTIIAHTWGKMERDQARKIMAIQNIDYMLRRS